MTTHLHVIPSYFRNPTHPISITLIGCGGTGSKLLTKLAALNHILLGLNHPGIDLICYDFDTIEPHNIGRQHFLPNDVNQYKAFNLVSKINRAYGFEWLAENDMFTIDLFEKNPSNIIITCIDTTQLRSELASVAFKTYKNTNYQTPFYWLDCGNGRDFGQVVLGTLRKLKQPKLKNKNTHDTLRNVVDIYGDLNQYDTQDIQGMESCSLVDSLLKQDLFINDEIALSGVKIIYKLLTKTSLNINGIVINQSFSKSQPLTLN